MNTAKLMLNGTAISSESGSATYLLELALDWLLMGAGTSADVAISGARRIFATTTEVREAIARA